MSNLERYQFLIEQWGEKTAEKLLYAIMKERWEMPFEFFLTNCNMVGGDWGQMLLTGISKVFPEVYKAIPDNMGVNARACLRDVLYLCGVGPKGV